MISKKTRYSGCYDSKDVLVAIVRDEFSLFYEYGYDPVGLTLAEYAELIIENDLINSTVTKKMVSSVLLTRILSTTTNYTIWLFRIKRLMNFTQFNSVVMPQIARS